MIHASGIAAAWTKDNDGGISMMWSLWTLTKSAYPPPGSKAMTRLLVISFVYGSTRYPLHSNPIVFVTPFGGGYKPLVCNKSALFAAVASTFIKTSVYGSYSGTSQVLTVID